VSRRDFFEPTASHPTLSEHAQSGDSSLRWAAAIELGEIPEKWSAELLWTLKDDVDQYVSAVAKQALGKFDPSLIEQNAFLLKGEPERKGPEASSVSSVLADHVSWKTRPMEVPSEVNEWAVSAAIVDIVNTEGPLTGARLMRLYGECVFPNSPRKLSKARMKRAAAGLISRGVISTRQSDNPDSLESWILFRSNTPEVSLRTKGARKLSEIPVTEVLALTRERSPGARAPNPNRQLQIILEAYAIPQNELHLVGAILEGEWSSLLGPSTKDN
jgi:hypothetical protein